MFLNRILSSVFLTLTACIAFTGSVHGDEPFEGFLKKHCVACHGPEKMKGDVRIDQLSRDFKRGA
ncbi:MAG: c-type cytochrome domain-containing protein, partial [Planctomycetota bacterium]